MQLAPDANGAKLTRTNSLTTKLEEREEEEETDREREREEKRRIEDT